MRSPTQSMAGDTILGLTVLDFLKDSRKPCFEHLNIYQSTATGWETYSQENLIEQVDSTAAGLIALGLNQGDRVGFLLKSDVTFLALDIACAQANLVSVPIDLSQTIENIIFSLNHSDARVLVVTNVSILNQILPFLERAKSLQWVILRDQPEVDSLRDCCSIGGYPSGRGGSPSCPMTIPPSIGLELCSTLTSSKAELSQNHRFELLSWRDLCLKGQEFLSQSPDLLLDRDALRSPQDLATLIYIPDEDGSLKGVMLSHENLTSTALAAFAGMKGLKWGDRESVVTFLPLTHIFARVMLYGHLYYSHTVYFSSPQRVMKHLQEVRPTILSTVPILIHRIFHKLEKYGDPQEATPFSQKGWRQWLPRSLDRVKRRGHQWAMAIAQRPIQPQKHRLSPRAVLEKPFAALVFRQWRKILGGRLRYCLTGGAALDPEIAQFFLKIGLPVYQGYGLTQTSSVVTFNQPGHNCPGTVGQLRTGATCTLGQDGEVLVKGTGVMQGYFKESRATSIAIDEQGWFHTGDLGEFDAQGHLTLLGCKKSPFKLTTGKYVTPLPLEAALERSPLVYRALVVGEARKYCGAILFVDQRTLLNQAQKMGLTHFPVEVLFENPCIRTLYESLVERANCYFPYWSTIKRIQLLPASVYPPDWVSHAHFSVRAALILRFSAVIQALYQDPHSDQQAPVRASPNECGNIPLVSCPLVGQSLNTQLS